MWVVEGSPLKLGLSPDDYTITTPPLRAEKVVLRGLKPGTRYYYDLRLTQEMKGYFKTAPEGRSSFTFVVYGDTRTRHELHKKVTEAIRKIGPDFIVHTGDLVANGNTVEQWPVFFSIERDLLRETAFFPVLGNHERNCPEYYEFFDVTIPYYSFNWGTAHFTMLNSDLGNVAASDEAKKEFWARQLRWLEEDLEANQQADFRFVVMHHPPFTAVKKRQGSNPEVQAMVPVFEKYHVTAVFNGHDHNYQHHLKNGIHYIVTGGGGAPLYPVDAPMKGITLKVETTEHYVRIKVDGTRAEAEAIALDGHLIDRVELGQ